VLAPPLLACGLVGVLAPPLLACGLVGALDEDEVHPEASKLATTATGAKTWKGRAMPH
jgi:hypothetical protein